MCYSLHFFGILDTCFIRASLDLLLYHHSSAFEILCLFHPLSEAICLLIGMVYSYKNNIQHGKLFRVSAFGNVIFC